jgi:hypothetical protein
MFQNGISRVCLYFCSTEQNSEHFSLRQNVSEWNCKGLLLFLFHVKKSKHFALLRNGWNGIPRVCFYFCSTVQNSKHFFLPRIGSEQNSESFLFRGTSRILPEQINCTVLYRIPSIFCFQGMVRNGIPRVFCSTEHPEFRRNKPIANCSVHSVFRGIIFFFGNCQPYFCQDDQKHRCDTVPQSLKQQTSRKKIRRNFFSKRVVYCTGFQAYFSSKEWFGTEFRNEDLKNGAYLQKCL